jgi:hypothetical protein
MQALHEAAPLADAAAVLDERGQQGGQAVGQAGDDVGRAILQIVDVDPRLKDGTVSPDVRPRRWSTLRKSIVLLVMGKGVEWAGLASAPRGDLDLGLTQAGPARITCEKYSASRIFRPTLVYALVTSQ